MSARNNAALSVLQDHQQALMGVKDLIVEISTALETLDNRVTALEEAESVSIKPPQNRPANN